MLPTSKFATPPIHKVPYDVLREIFIQCLSKDAFKFPIIYGREARRVPLLLCQICSSWRTVALNSPILWSHLEYGLQIVRTDSSAVCFLKDQFTFISWWKRNQGSIAPFLCLSVHFRAARPHEDQIIPVDAPEGKLLLEYLKSAQYLRADAEYWHFLQRLNRLGYEVRHPNLHTLANSDQTDYQLQDCVVPSTLRRLALNDAEGIPENFSIPIRWTGLTHLSVTNFVMPLKFWFALVRAVPALEWASFDIERLHGVASYVEPPEIIVPHLSELYVHFYDESCRFTVEFPLSMLFKNLCLPALHTLSLTSFHDPSWGYRERGLIELYTVLKSSRGLQRLMLGENFMSIGTASYTRASATITGSTDYQAPIWNYVPNLVDIKFEILDTSSSCMRRTDFEVAEELDAYVYNLFFEDSFLGINDPACPIRNITLIDFRSDDQHFRRVKKFIKSSFLEHVEATPNIELWPMSDVTHMSTTYYQDTVSDS